LTRFRTALDDRGTERGSVVGQAAENAGPESATSGRAAERAAERRSLEALVFELAAERYALPLADVAMVLRAVAIRALPAAPAIVEGVFDLRGELVPVLDMRARFRLPHKPLDPGEHLIVAQVGTRRVALRADQALALERLDVVAIEAAGNLPRGVGYVAGVASTDGGMVLIHDLRAFLSEAESLELERALQAAADESAPSDGAP
jgi:purine-binding chemotaxis protein CheW